MSQETFEIEFPEAGVAHRGEGTRAARTTESKSILWRKVTTAHKPKCDVCVGAMLAGAAWFAPDPVMYERSGDGTLVYLCYFHAAPLRDREGLKP